MVDIRSQKLISEFGLKQLLVDIAAAPKKINISQAMAIAIYEAYGGAQRVSPNPLVGCVVLDSHGNFLAKGHHEVFGSAHAEINALKNLDREKLQDATVVVTLEPCAHVGKTGSCALYIKDLPVKRVVYGLMDPFYLVSGKGAQIIQEAGKEVFLYSDLKDSSEGKSTPMMTAKEKEFISAQLEILAENFLKNFRQNKPFVALKWAQSLDGKMALKNYESQWITNAQSRAYAHYLRSVYDVLIVGSGTILQDNPKLNIRLENFEKESKILIIDPNAIIFKSFDRLELSKHHKKENVFFVVDTNSSETSIAFNLAVNPPGSFKNILFLHMNDSGFFPLEEIHKFCFERGMKSILVEGGPTTFGQYLNQSAFDRVYAFVAPIIMGEGLSYSDQFSIATMTQRLNLKSVEKLDVGDDILFTGLKSD